jgi:hypothetical protein
MPILFADQVDQLEKGKASAITAMQAKECGTTNTRTPANCWLISGAMWTRRSSKEV